MQERYKNRGKFRRGTKQQDNWEALVGASLPLSIQAVKDEYYKDEEDDIIKLSKE